MTAFRERLIPLLIASALAGVLAGATELWPQQPQGNPQPVQTLPAPDRPAR